jgi:hypothetical protein
MGFLPDHTVLIEGYGFYAESVDVAEPFRRDNYDSVEIENGPPRFYKTNVTLRQMTFKTTIMGNRSQTLDMLSHLHGLKHFTSIYIGSFLAIITLKLSEFTPQGLVANFTIQEVEK